MSQGRANSPSGGARRGGAPDFGRPTPRPGQAPADLSERFAAQVARTPGAVAVRAEDRTLTYAALHHHAAHLAAALRTRGVGPNTVVALYMERGIELVIATFAVLEAGGAYLTLDPGHPETRVMAALARARALGVIASAGALEGGARRRAADQAGTRWSCSVDELLARPVPEVAPATPAADHLACLVYPSGPDDASEGIGVPRRGMLAHLLAKIDELGLSEDDVIAQSGSQGCVSANWPLLAGLLAGAEVTIVAPERARDPRALLEQIRDGSVTVLPIEPALLRAVVEVLDRGSAPAPLPSLRWLVPAEEALAADLCRRWRVHYPGVLLPDARRPGSPRARVSLP